MWRICWHVSRISPPKHLSQHLRMGVGPRKRRTHLVTAGDAHPHMPDEKDGDVFSVESALTLLSITAAYYTGEKQAGQKSGGWVRSAITQEKRGKYATATASPIDRLASLRRTI